MGKSHAIMRGVDGLGRCVYVWWPRKKLCDKG